MFKGFSKEAIAFLKDIRVNNEKEWFEPRKQLYLDELFHPMKELCAEVSAPFMKLPSMIARAGRIYADPSFPPYKKYRESMWIIVKHEAYDWSKTPSLFFEISGDGAVFGFKITHPSAPVMEAFRQKIVTDDGDFFKLAKRIERSGIVIGGEEYKRPKPCTVPQAERFCKKKSLLMTLTVSESDPLLYSPKLSETVRDTFKKLLPVNELFDEFVAQAEAEKLALKLAAAAQPEPEMPKAPDVDFMW